MASPSDSSGARFRILRCSAAAAPRSALDELAVEEPLEIRVDTRAVSVTMRTPGHDQELAAGFLVTEGVVDRPADIRDIRRYPGNAEGHVVGVFTAPGVRVDFKRLTRHFYASSSCGLCGKACIASVRQRFPPLRARWTVGEGVILSLPARMRASQSAFERTGGLHAAALFHPDGSLLVIREDVGRHNAVDKVIGHAVLNGRFPLDRHILMVSGRASFEIMQKAMAGRVSMIVAVGAPSSLAVEFARSNGQTLIGFLREDRFNIYSRAGRVVRQPA